jgi:hypothetical protein
MATTPFLLTKMIEQHPFARFWIFFHLRIDLWLAAVAGVHIQTGTIFNLRLVNLSAELFVARKLYFAAYVSVHARP